MTNYRRGGGARRRLTLAQSVAANLLALSAMAPTAEAGAAAVATLGGYPKARTPRAPAVPRADAGASEAQVLSAVLAYLRHSPDVAWVARMNVGAMQDGDGQYVKFGFVGCSDIIGQMRDGRFLAVECKREKGNKLSGPQAAFLERVRAANGVAGMVRSVDEAALLLRYAMEGR